MPRVSRFFPVAVLVVGVFLPLVGRADEPAARPAAWARKIDRPGLPNLHQVSDGLYRGAQPTAEGIKELENMGVKTIICLRSGKADRAMVAGSSLVLEEISMNAWDVNEEYIVRFLNIAADRNRQPAFVHCQHGADRTGAMCAAYRVVIDGWTKQQAIEEMTNGGFNFHAIWINLPGSISNMNVEAIKEKVGLKD